MTGKRVVKKLGRNSQKDKALIAMRKQKLAFHKQNNIYGHYLIQESKDIDRTLESLESFLM